MPTLGIAANAESPSGGTPRPDSRSSRANSDWSNTPKLYAMEDSSGDAPTLLPGMPSTPDRPDLKKSESKISVAKPRRASQVESKAVTYGWTDPEDMKQRVIKNSLDVTPPYDVFDYYWKTGVFQWLAKHWVFENLTLAIICLNAIYMAMDTDLNKDQMMKSGESNSLLRSPMVFQVLEHTFCTYFTGEWLIRFAAFRDKRNCFCDGWFFFDTILVTMMVGETWIFTAVAIATGNTGKSPIGNAAMLRLLRLLRLARLVRMLRSLPQLMMLVKGMMAAMASVFYVMCLLLIVTYVFAIGFTQLTAGHELGAKYFANVSVAMYSLMIYATFGDNLADFMNDLRSQMWPLLVFCLIYMSLAQLTLMNMLVGVLCDVVSSVAVREREERSMSQMIEDMKLIFATLDKDFDNEVSYKEFSAMIEMPEALSVLRRQEVNPEQVLDLADLFFFEDGEPIQLSFEEFIDVIMSLRESNEATVKDIWYLWVQYRNARRKDVMEQECKLEEVNRRIERVTTRLGSKIDQTSAKLEEKLVGLLGELRQVPQPRSATPTPVSTTSVAGRRASNSVKAEAGNVRKVTSTVSRLVSKRSDAETKERN